MMRRFIQVEFSNINLALSEILVAELSNAGYDGFEELNDTLRAYVQEAHYNEDEVKYIAGRNKVEYAISILPETNWNTEWESSFPPVVIDGFVGIRADFHNPIPGVEVELIITPKMSFGTGHHATTLLMIRQMASIDFHNKTVLDFGTGTGILAILAEKRGAASVLAIDYDDWSIQNARENIKKNKCSRITVREGDQVPSGIMFDIILANVNKPVIQENFLAMNTCLKNDGQIVLSGLLNEDERDLHELAGKTTLTSSEKTTRENWMAISFYKDSINSTR